MAALPSPASFGDLLAAPFRPHSALPKLLDDKSKLWLLGALLIMALSAAAGYLNAQRLIAQSAFAPPPGSLEGVVVVQEGPPPAGPQPNGQTPTPIAPDTSGMAGMITAGTSAVGLWVGWLISALITYFGSVLLGGRGGFAPVFKLTALAQLPLAFRAVLRLAYLTLGGGVIKAEGLSGLLPAAQGAPPGFVQTLLGNLLASIDLFTLWSLLLLVIGLTIATRIKRAQSVVLVFVMLLLSTLLFSLPALLGGALSGG
jgi:hypothetical protein